MLATFLFFAIYTFYCNFLLRNEYINLRNIQTQLFQKNISLKNESKGINN